MGAQVSSFCFSKGLGESTTVATPLIDWTENITTGQVDAVLTGIKRIMPTPEFAARMPIVHPLNIQVQLPDVQAVFYLDVWS